jgi:N-acetylmuramoyl-L-alanine amidase
MPTSPNFSSRANDPFVTIIHYDGSPIGRAAVAWMCNPVSRVSAHAHIDRDGTVTELVPWTKTAWHAGVAAIRLNGVLYQDVNGIAIGIELANIGKLKQYNGRYYYTVYDAARGINVDREWHGTTPVSATLTYSTGLVSTGLWEPFPDVQIQALVSYLDKIRAAGFVDAATNLYGHDEVALPVGRKSDPGPVFPWDKLTRRATRTVQST